MSWRKLAIVIFGWMAVALTAAGAPPNNRSAVSVNGLDTNPCTTASPCRSFAAALLVTVDGGEVIALDSAGFGTFTVNKSVTVSGSSGIHAAVTATSGNAIAVSNGSLVVLSNLFILGGNSANTGIYVGGATYVRVSNCFIQGFTGYGIRAVVNTPMTVVDHTTVVNSFNGTGIEFENNQGAVEDSSISFCSTGIQVLSSSAQAKATIHETNVRFNTSGVVVNGTASLLTAEVMVERCSISGNTGGVAVNGSGGGGASVILSGNAIDSVSGSGTYAIWTTGNNTIQVTPSATLTPFSLR